MKTALLILIGVAMTLGIVLEALTLVRSIRCRAFTDRQGGSNLECRVVWP